MTIPRRHPPPRATSPDTRRDQPRLALLTPAGGQETTRISISRIAEGIDWCLEVCADPERNSGFTAGVSAWSVPEHLEHLLRVDRSVFEWIVAAVGRPNPPERSETPNPIGLHILETGVIPRGKGPAPEGAVPRAAPLGEVVAGLGRVRGLTDGLETKIEAIHDCRATLPHHVLGHFTPNDWLRFLHIHHDHHARIVEDILV